MSLRAGTSTGAFGKEPAAASLPHMKLSPGFEATITNALAGVNAQHLENVTSGVENHSAEN
jgi:hypothetical protein